MVARRNIRPDPHLGSQRIHKGIDHIAHHGPTLNGGQASARKADPLCSLGCLGNSDNCVGPLPQLGQELDPEAWLHVHRDLAFRDDRQFGDELRVPSGIEGPHAFLDQGIPCVKREVARCGIDHGTRAVMGRHGNMPSLGESGDLARLRQAAAP